MNLRIKAFYAIVLGLFISTLFQCASPKVATTTFELKAPFQLESVKFQEWYAGIEVGGTGINVFLPISEIKENIEFEDIYFRNIKGKLFKNDGKYMAVLKNPSKHYTFKIPEKPADYPFTLQDNECVISYIEDGKLKYYKVLAMNEVAGTYYENGPPSFYVRQSSSGLATLDAEEEDN